MKKKFGFLEIILFVWLYLKRISLIKYFYKLRRYVFYLIRELIIFVFNRSWVFKSMWIIACRRVWIIPIKHSRHCKFLHWNKLLTLAFTVICALKKIGIILWWHWGHSSGKWLTEKYFSTPSRWISI
jgi:hypothetical protein